MLNPKLDRPEVWANIAEIRRAEMDARAGDPRRRPGLAGLRRLGPARGRSAAAAARGLLRPAGRRGRRGPAGRLMREFRPHVVTTYDEEGGYPHPDHIMCHKVSVAAFEAAGDPERYPELGEPWQPLKLYYDIGFSKGKIMALHEGMLAAGLESPYEEWLKRWEDRARQGPADHHPGRVRRILPGPRRRAAGPRHPGRPGRLLVPRADGAPAAGLADRGLRAGPLDGRQPAARVRPLRREYGRRRTRADSRRGYPGYQPHIGGTPC